MGSKKEHARHAKSVPRPKNDALEKAYEGSDVLSRHRQRAGKRCSVQDFAKTRRDMLLLNLSIDTQ